MSEFEFDEEIGISNFKDFELLKKVNFKHQDPSGQFWGLNKNGYMIAGFFARKIERRVIISIDGYQCDIPKSLADKIIAGEI
jgi:hypothetical protein